jgi:hypothetical protein
VELPVGQLAYRAGECARCAGSLRESEPTQEVALLIIGPGGTVSIHCWIDQACQPDQSEVQTVSRELAMRLVGWYRSTPTVWPMLVSRHRD